MSASKIATRTVLYYFQSWGQPLEKRVSALNECVKAAGLKATFQQTDNAAGWSGLDSDKAKQFREELDACFPLGEFESEAAAVDSLIERHRLKSARRS